MRLGYKSRALLDMMLASCVDSLDMLTFPTRYLTGAGGWDEERYLTRHIKRMRDEGWIVWDDSKETGKWVLKVTAAGKRAAQEDFDPEARWARAWDKQWRMVVFDLPACKWRLRNDLLNWLKSKRFGRLQDSLWIAPFFESSWSEDLKRLRFDPSGVSFLEGRTFSKSNNRDFVKKAWNFDEINKRYKLLMDFHRSLNSRDAGSAIPNWIQAENKLWRDAFDLDPFLPNSLLPRSYIGKKAIAARRRSYLAAASNAQ